MLIILCRKLTEETDAQKVTKDSEADYSGAEHNYHRSSKTECRKAKSKQLANETTGPHARVSTLTRTEEVTVIDLPNESGNEFPGSPRKDGVQDNSFSGPCELGISPAVLPPKKSRSKSRSKVRTKRSSILNLTPRVCSLPDQVCLADAVTESGGDIRGLQETEVGREMEGANVPDLNCTALCDRNELNVDRVKEEGLHSTEELLRKSSVRSSGDEKNGLTELEEDPSIYKYVCEFCNETDRTEFRTESELSRHKTKSHWDLCHRCKTCGRKFCSQKGLRTHMKLHMGTQPMPQRRKKFKCNECDLLFHTSAALDGHRSKHTGEKPWACETCGQRFTMRSSMERHQHLHSGYKPFLCDFCGKGFVQKWNLSEHMVNAHRDTEQEYECALCSGRFKHRSEIEKHALEAHQLTHLEELNAMVKQSEAYLCDFCGKNLLSVKALKLHMKTHSAQRPKCEICDKTFSSYSALYMHRKIHSGEKPYICEICQKGFRQKPAFASHVATHSRVRPFVCVVCSKSFANKSQLKQHMVLHSDEKAYTCGICHKQFATKSYFTLHNRTHTGDKPHTCSVCGFAFAVKHHLNRHMRVHTGEKPFMCQVCNKRYKNNIDLRYHYTRFHKLDFERISINNRSKYIFKLDHQSYELAGFTADSDHNVLNPSGFQSSFEFAG